VGEKNKRFHLLFAKHVSGNLALLEKTINIHNITFSEEYILDKLAELKEQEFSADFSIQEKQLLKLQRICYMVKHGDEQYLSWARLLACDFHRDLYYPEEFEILRPAIAKIDNAFLKNADLIDLKNILRLLKKIYLTKQTNLSQAERIKTYSAYLEKQYNVSSPENSSVVLRLVK